MVGWGHGWGGGEDRVECVCVSQTVRIGRGMQWVLPRTGVNLEAPHVNAVIGQVTTTSRMILVCYFHVLDRCHDAVAQRI